MAYNTSKRRMCGIGIYDTDESTILSTDGKTVYCPFYKTWRNMFIRCYSEVEHKRSPCYIGCTVANEWHLFSAFKSWMESKEWDGKALDKDIIKPGNKVYSSETCCFVPHAINALIVRPKKRGGNPRGVSIHRKTGLFFARYKADGKVNYLGYFKTPEEASIVYRKEKADHVFRIAHQQTDPRVNRGLIKHSEIIRGEI